MASSFRSVGNVIRVNLFLTTYEPELGVSMNTHTLDERNNEPLSHHIPLSFYLGKKRLSLSKEQANILWYKCSQNCVTKCGELALGGALTDNNSSLSPYPWCPNIRSAALKLRESCLALWAANEGKADLHLSQSQGNIYRSCFGSQNTLSCSISDLFRGCGFWRANRGELILWQVWALSPPPTVFSGL